MSHPQRYGESVLFAFTRDHQVLCEWREWRGQMQHSIPGGKIEPIDHQEANYQRALNTARTNDDSYTEAAALTGLGQTAYAAQADDKAVDRFKQALTIYQILNEEKLASAVEGLLAEIK